MTFENWIFLLIGILGIVACIYFTLKNNKQAQMELLDKDIKRLKKELSTIHTQIHTQVNILKKFKK